MRTYVYNKNTATIHFLDMHEVCFELSNHSLKVMWCTNVERLYMVVSPTDMHGAEGCFLIWRVPPLPSLQIRYDFQCHSESNMGHTFACITFILGEIITWHKTSPTYLKVVVFVSTWLLRFSFGQCERARCHPVCPIWFHSHRNPSVVRCEWKDFFEFILKALMNYH